jgi:uncharacterized protein
MLFKSKFLILLAFLFIASWSIAQDLPEAPKRLVTDQLGLLSDQQVSQLERKLVAFSDTNSTQIAIFITGDLQGYDIVDFSQRVAQKWGVGQKKYDNGAIIVLIPKTANSKGEVNIDVGYGLEPIIPDITAKRIIENEMIPQFRNNDYYAGLNAAVDVMISLAAGQFTADEYKNRTQDEGAGAGFIIPFIVLIIIIILINRNKGNNQTIGRRGGSSLWTALLLGSMMSGGGGSWGNFRSGSGGFGGGGGGFGGFGGGSFGGGGASGSW